MTKNGKQSGYWTVNGEAISGNLKGGILMLVSGAGFTLYLLMNKLLSADLHPIVLAIARAFFGIVFALPFVLRSGLSSLSTRRPWMLVGRSLCGTIGFTLAIISVSDLYSMTLAQFNAISFTRPLFVTILAALLLGETVGRHRWMAVLMGFIGVIIMVLPGLNLFGGTSPSPQGQVDFSIATALGSAFFLAAAIVMVKFLTAELKPMVLLFYANLFSTILLVPFAIAYWSDIPVNLWGAIILMCLFGFLSQLCFISAMSVGDASFLSPFDYLRLPMSAVADFAVYRLVPGLNVWFGAIIIVGSTLYISWRERRRRQV